MTGAEFQAWMRDHGWTVEELATALGWSARSVIRWRQASTIPRWVVVALPSLEDLKHGERG